MGHTVHTVYSSKDVKYYHFKLYFSHFCRVYKLDVDPISNGIQITFHLAKQCDDVHYILPHFIFDYNQVSKEYVPL